MPKVLEALGMNLQLFLSENVHEDQESDIFYKKPDSPILNAPISPSERPFRRQKIAALENFQLDLGDLADSFRAVCIDKLNRR